MLAGCTSKSSGTFSSREKEITEKVHELYKIYDDSNNALYDHPFSERLFSPELKQLLTDAVNKSKEDIENVKNSDHPDEKPLLIEGSLFTSMYEGYTEYKIKSVTIDPSQNSAEVAVNFEYKESKSKYRWTDKIHVIHSGNEWTIDNIYFGGVGYEDDNRDLKTTLKNFANFTK